MECYNCGAKLGKGDICQNCGANVKIYKKIIMASNAYYNDALEKAAVRDLSGAIESLRTSLRFYKMNIDARNLLGLVYFETGEVVEALTEWVISKNYQPRDNAASRYLNEIQNNPSRLDTINQTIKKYNQALLYCRQDSRDLAIIQLKKVLSLNPKLVSGHQLLALLYIQENNPKKQKNEDLISYQSGNETIIQPRYLKDNSAIGTIINMVIGIAIGAAITCFLIVPGVRREIQNQAKAEVLDANNAVASKNQSISSLEAQIEDLTSQITDAKNEEESSAGKVNTYEQLLQAYVAYTDGDIEKAGTALGNVNTDYLSDDSMTVYDTINAQVNAEYISAVYKEATDAYNAQEFTQAIEDYLKVIELDETYDNGNALYYLAQSYRRNDDMDNAKTYYQKFADLYPGTERAANAQRYLNTEE